MKVVQVGILVALVVVAGLLYMVYRGQAPEPAAVVPAAQAPAAAEVAAPPVTAPPAETVAPPPELVKSEPAPKRPSPAPKRRSPATVAESRPPEAAPSPTPAPAAPAPVAQQPASQPAPTPAPEPPPAPVLNPPSGTQTAAPAPRTPQRVTVPAGTMLSIRLGEALSSDKNQAGDSFSATLEQPLVVEGFVLAERGARVEGRVLEADRGGRVKGVSSLTVHLVKLHTSDGQEVTLQTQAFTKRGETSKAEDAKKVGVGAAIGAAIGAIAGGGRGAAIGAGVGAGAGAGTAAATYGKPAVLPVETHLNFRLEQALTLTEKLK